MLQIPMKLLKTTFTLSTLGSRYLGGCCRRDIRVQRPRKLPKKDADTVHPGHQVPRRLWPSRYSYSATPKTPE
ncbi:hypothetical protein TSAR_003777 [Trichomalopsis sarcophagae]|uniref:Uncharacterized protein n=1 Tax=Trichomalopsis sarcophagae TaxID=543379 RepID=A0A232FHG4_9HYME|nr:hypothetical protein TSAR_003777 [Trichomalopsis sarcophagae]